MASTTASNWQQREEEAVKKLIESLPQWTGSLDDDAPLPRGTKTQTGVLPESGLTYYWRKNDEPRDRVELVIAVRAGSIDETDDERGLAHVLEHLAFRARNEEDGTRFSALRELDGRRCQFWSGLDGGRHNFWPGLDWRQHQSRPSLDWRRRRHESSKSKHIFSSNKESASFDFDIRRNHDCRYSSHHTNCKSSE